MQGRAHRYMRSKRSNREIHHNPSVDATLMDQHSGLPLISRQWIKGPSWPSLPCFFFPCFEHCQSPEDLQEVSLSCHLSTVQLILGLTEMAWDALERS